MRNCKIFKGYFVCAVSDELKYKKYLITGFLMGRICLPYQLDPIACVGSDGYW